MTYRLMQLKDELVNELVQEHRERGRVDDDKVDAVKDIAEAIYYCKVTEAMGGNAGYSQQGQGSMGYGAGTGSSAGYGSQGGMRQGYMGADVMEPLRMALQSAGPDEREHIRNEVRAMIGAM